MCITIIINLIKLFIVFYNEINTSVTFEKLKYANENFINLYSLTKRRHVSVLMTKNMIEFNKTQKQSFILCLKNLKNDCIINIYNEKIHNLTYIL